MFSIQPKAEIPDAREQSIVIALSLDTIPEEMWVSIISNLGSAKDLTSFGEACRTFHLISQEEVLWKVLFRNDFPGAFSILSPSPDHGYLDLYRDCAIQMRNFGVGVYKKRTLEGPTKGVARLEVEGNRLVAGSENGTIEIWDMETKERLHELKDCTDINGLLKVAGKYLVTAKHLDGTTLIFIWDVETGKRLHEIRVDSNLGVQFLKIVGNRLFVGYDTTMGIWNIKTGERQHLLTGHEHFVSCCDVIEKHLFTGSWDKTVRIWNLETGEFQCVIKVCENHINDLKVVRKYLVLTSKETIQICDIETGKCLHEFKCEEYHRFNDLQVVGKYFVANSADKKICIWNRETWQLLHQPTCLGDNLQLQAVEKYLIGGSGVCATGQVPKKAGFRSGIPRRESVFMRLIATITGSIVFRWSGAALCWPQNMIAQFGSWILAIPQS